MRGVDETRIQRSVGEAGTADDARERDPKSPPDHQLARRRSERVAQLTLELTGGHATPCGEIGYEERTVQRGIDPLNERPQGWFDSVGAPSLLQPFKQHVRTVAIVPNPTRQSS